MKFKPNLSLGVRLPVILLFFSFLIFSSCKKDDDPIGSNAGNGTITMKVDGITWTSKDAVDGAVVLDSQGSLNIQGFADDDSNIGLTLPTPSQGDTWNFDGGGAFLYRLDLTGAGWTHLPTVGTSTITFSTFSSEKAKGTFQGTLIKFDGMGNQEEIILSDGSFDLNF